jgi:sugar O-acyltransferase (sialic acid O-acetyltransferase NeuD family)
MKKIAIIGGGGLAKEYIEVLEMCSYLPYGIFAKENHLKNIPYYGYLNELISLKKEFDGVVLAIGGINAEGIHNRKKVIDFLTENAIPSLTLVSPKTTISKNVIIGEGCYIHHLAAISCDAIIGAHSLINTAAMIGHDVQIGENCTISPQAFIGGGVTIGANSLIGVGAIIKQGLSIGENCIVGMGTVVQRSIQSNMMIVHNHTKPVALN